MKMGLNDPAEGLGVRCRRLRLHSWVFIVWLCVQPFWLAAQDKGTPLQGPDALSLVKQAMGGARWDEVRALHAQGKVEIGELPGNYDAWFDLRRLYSYTETRFSHPALGDTWSASGWNGSLA